MPSKAKLTTRQETTSQVSSDNFAKGSELSFAEADSNFINLRDQSIAISDGSTSTDIEAGETITFSGATVSGNTVSITGGDSLGDLTATGSTLSAPSNANMRLQTSGTGAVEVQDDFIISNTQASDETQGEMFRVQTTGGSPPGSTADFNHNGNQGGNNGGFSIYGTDGQGGGANVPFFVDYGAQATVKINGYTMPTGDGSSDQIIKTDGSNTLSFTSISSIIPNTYVQSTDTGLIVVGDDSTGTSFNVGETLKVAGGNGCSTSISGDTLTIDFDQSEIPTQPANTGNFEFITDTMRGKSTNTDITIQANGTGDIILDADTVKVGSGSETASIKANGTNNLTLTGGSNETLTITNNDSDAGASAIHAGPRFFIVGNNTGHARLLSRGQHDLFLQTDSGNGLNILKLRHSGSTAVEIDGGALALNDNNITNVATINAVQLETQGVAINDNNITTRRSNEDLVLDAAGTGAVSILTQKVMITNLPTSDPTTAGQLWNDSGTLKISAG